MSLIYGPRAVPLEDDDPGTVGLDPTWVLPRRVRWWAEREPDRPFLTEVTGRSSSYGQTWQDVLRWQSLLRRLGLQRGEAVLSLLPSSIDAHLLWLAAGSLGLLEVAVNPDLRGEFLRHALTDSGARVCVVRPEHAALVAGAGVALQVVEVDRDGALVADLPPDDPYEVAPADPACVLCTSGTTGPAKGVVVSWAQLSTTLGRLPRPWLGDQEVAYSYLPMSHVTGRSPLVSMAAVGGRVVLREKFSAQAFWTDVRAHGCTTTTALVSLLLAAPPADDDRDHPLRLAFGGSNVTQNVQFEQRFGVHLISCYGSTEVGFPMVDRWLTPGVNRCGWLRAGYQARLVDERGEDVAPGSVGELWVRAPAPELRTSGYLNRPDLTAATLVDGWFRTGDALVALPDGSFRFVDRLRDTIRRLGENISASALEAVVAGDPAVVLCAALAVPDELVGQEVLLAVVLRDGDAAALWERLQPQLPRLMHPRWIAVREELPLTASGKVRKDVLLGQLDLSAQWSRP